MSETTKKEKVVKVKKTQVEVFNLSNMNPALLPELATFKEIQLKAVADNPFVEIVDVASRELAKKHRTALVSARTSLQNQDKLISSKFNEAKTKAKTYIAELISETQPAEIKQQQEIDREQALADAKKLEKEKLEQERVDGIKSIMDNFTSSWNSKINSLVFEEIDSALKDFTDAKDTFDFKSLQEFETLMPAKIADLSISLSNKMNELQGKENDRLLMVKLAEEKAIADAENEAIKKKAELQAIRLNSIVPYISFGEQVDITNLSDLDQVVFDKILSSKKSLFDADLKAKQDVIEAKEKQDKIEADKIKADAIAVLEIRKSRLLKVGVDFDSLLEITKESISSESHSQFEIRLEIAKEEFDSPKSIEAEVIVPVTVSVPKTRKSLESIPEAKIENPNETAWKVIFKSFITDNQGFDKISDWLIANYEAPKLK